jgi:uncharacterized membrane protein
MIHRFLVSQSLYPIVLSSLFAMALFTGRVLYGRSWNYNNLVWNLFLAWIPYLCSMGALLTYFRRPRAWGLLLIPGLLWLAFFPNAPYIVTDFLHLEQRPRIPLWYDILMLASFAWTGCFLAVASLRAMQFLVRRYLGRFVSWLFVFATIALSGLGIYLGRFGRWNSWDLLFQPKQVLKDILIYIVNPYDNLRFFGFTFAFTVFLFILYWMFASITRIEEPQKDYESKERLKSTL